MENIVIAVVRQVINSGQQSQANQPSTVTTDSNSVQTYLNILQGIIARMASNSANCKTWCVSLVSVILLIIAFKNKPNYSWITLIPTAFFFLLDSYYLGQERSFRGIYNEFISDLHSGNAKTNRLFVLKPLEGMNMVNSLFASSISFSIYPFYLTLVSTIIIARFLIL